jgi:uncharacterized protein
VEQQTPVFSLDGTSHTLDPRVRVVWAVGSAVVPLLLGVTGAVVGLVTGNALLAVVAAVAGAVLIAVAVVSAQLRWTRWSWSAWNDALELRHGVITKRASLVPYHRIQQIDVHRGPLERVLGIASLVLRTASATTDAEIPGIPAPQADALRHRLLASAGVDDAV